MALSLEHVTCIFSLSLWLLIGRGYAHGDNPESKSEIFEIHMPDVRPSTEDEYICVSRAVPDGVNYVTQYEALAEGGTAHHLLLFGCEEPAHKDKTWYCGSLCKSHTEPSKIMFAWAKNAPPTRLPKDVGFQIGGSSKVKYIVLQIHYRYAFTDDQSADTSGVRLTLTSQRQTYQAGVMILLSTTARIPAHVPKIHADVSCKYQGPELHPFAFRVHAHDLSTVITGYLYNKTWTLMGKGNPQWPQAFYPMDSAITIKPGDYLVARCTYDASNKDVDTVIGPNHNDEMCNFYFMYYAASGAKNVYRECIDNRERDIAKRLPAGSDVPPPPNPLLDGHHHHHHDAPEGEGDGTGDGVEGAGSAASVYPELNVVHNWPRVNQEDDVKLGQVAGVAMDSKGNVHVFHRGSREWVDSSFDNANHFNEPEKPIAENVLVTFSPEGKVIDQWGKDMFFMPHGIYIDKEDNIWVTDVAMHQVFRFPAHAHTADRMFGTRMQPGADDNHLCKPTDVTVISTGEVYVTDGYCNSRVLKYSPEGLLLKKWGTLSKDVLDDGFPAPGTFMIPHSITDVPRLHMVCVADRENGRVQCFDYDGKFVRQYHPEAIQGPIYALDYCPDYDVLLLVNGADSYKKHAAVAGYTVDVTSGDVMQTWSPDNKGFSRPHDVTVGRNGTEVYVAEIGPNNIWKFVLNATEPRRHGHPHSVDDSVDERTEKQLEQTNQADFGASIVIGALLVIPVLIIVIIVVFLRVRKQQRSVGYTLVMPTESDSGSEGEEELFLKTHPNKKHVSFSPQHQRKSNK